jgi:hypothetical protein
MSRGADEAVGTVVGEVAFFLGVPGDLTDRDPNGLEFALVRRPSFEFGETRPRRIKPRKMLMIFPLVLGAGKRLFAEGAESVLKLVEARPMGDAGVVTLIYAPA